MRKGTKKKLKTTKGASLPFLTRDTPNNSQTLQKFKVPDFTDISVILTHIIITIPLSIFFLPGEQTLFACYLLSHKRFSVFFELLDNLATHITWLSEEDLAELSSHLRGSFKHSVGSEEFDKANNRKQMW